MGGISKAYAAKARKRAGGSNVGKKTFANGKKRTGPYAGPSGGAPKGSYPIPDLAHAKAAIKLSGHAPNPAGIRAAVRRKFPQLKKHEEGGIVEFKKGGIHINPKNKGKFNALKKRTGKSTAQLTHSKNPLTRKRAVFAQNAKKWHHEEGGLVEYNLGGAMSGIGGVLGAIPTPFTQIAGAGLGLIGNIIGGNEQRRAEEQARLQQVNSNVAMANQTLLGNPYQATFQTGGKVHLYPKVSDAWDDYLRYLQAYGVNDFGLSASEAKELTPRELKGRGVDLDTNGLKYYNAFIEERMKKYNPNDESKNKKTKPVQYTDKFGRPLGLSFASGGIISNGVPNIEVEGGEQIQGPNGSMASVQGPSHSQGGVDLSAQPGSRIFSDKLRASTGRTFAEEANIIRKKLARYEKILS